MFSWIKDWLLKKLQQDCIHPGDYVAVDIAEGSIPYYRVGYCRRCGAVRVEHSRESHRPGHVDQYTWDAMSPAMKYKLGIHLPAPYSNLFRRVPWRNPDPFLWRNYDPKIQSETGRKL